MSNERKGLVADTLHDAYVQGYDHAAAGKDALDVDAFIEAGVALLALLTQAQEPVARVESGPVRVGDDWAGVFIRGDEAMSRSIQIRGVAEEYEQNGSPLIAANLNGFADLLASCHEPCDATTLYASPVASVAAATHDPEALREALEKIKREWEELVAEMGGFDPNDQDAIKASAALRFYEIARRAISQHVGGEDTCPDCGMRLPHPMGCPDLV